MTAEIITFGCRLNIADSEAIRALGPGDDTIIVNSCAVTAEAVRQARKAIRKASQRRPDARIIVTGCAAQTEPDSFAAMPEVARVLGNADKFVAANLAFTDADPPAEVRVSDIMTVRTLAPHLAGAFADRARAFVEVQTGCDHRCTFCVIPYGRGNSRSVPAGLVVERIKALAGDGVAEVVLTGVDLTSWGADLPGKPTLGGLVHRILRHVPDLSRLRLSSIDQVEVDEELFDLLAHEPRLMPHLHLSLQSGDDMILKRMKRRHSRAQAVEFCQRLKAARPDMAFGADLIAGFPTETDAMADNSLSLIEDCDIVFGHIFPYSARAGTPAARMPQVPPAVRKARAARLRTAADVNRTHWLKSQVGRRDQLLLEGDGSRGHGRSFAPIRIDETGARGDLIDIVITDATADTLFATRLESPDA